MMLLPLLTATLTLASAQTSGLGQPAEPGHPVIDTRTLHERIADLDEAMFTAFNGCDGDAFGAFLTEDLEFYHDDDGKLPGREVLIEAVNTSICGNFTRQLVEDSLEVWPVPGWGAIQTGVHTFTNVGADAPHGQGRFLHLWEQSPDDGQWRIARIVSYDHGPFEGLGE